MASLNISINGTEQLIKVTLVKEQGRYFNVFCLNSQHKKHASLKGASNAQEIMEFLSAVSIQKIITFTEEQYNNIESNITKLINQANHDDINVAI